MGKLGTIFFENRYAFIGIAFFFLIGAFGLICCSKAESFFFINTYHNQLLDRFFTYYTNVGDGLFSIGIFVILLWKRKPLPGWEIVIAFLLSGLVAQLVKHFFQMPRPKTYFAVGGYPHFIDGVTLSGYASFPSGHTATAFATALLLSIFTKNKKYSLLFVLAAWLVAFSRIYLGQHFLQDVFVGALIGIVCSLTVYLVFDAHPYWGEKLKFGKMA